MIKFKLFGDSFIIETYKRFQNRKPVINDGVIKERKNKKYNLPVIGHFSDKDVRFDSIMQAYQVTGINYHLIFESAIGKIKSAKGTYWEFENGRHWIKYKAQYIRQQNKYTKNVPFSGGPPCG